jgi:hypothetical protein
VKLALAVKIPCGRAAIVVAPGSLFATRRDKEGAAHGHDHDQRWHQIFYKDWCSGQLVLFSHGWPLNADAWDDQARGTSSKRR